MFRGLGGKNLKPMEIFKPLKEEENCMKMWWKRRGKKEKKLVWQADFFLQKAFCICYTHFLHMDTKECTETRPVLSPPDALNRGAFQ